MTLEMTPNLIWNEKLDASVKRQRHARGVSLTSIMTRPKQAKGYWTADLFVYYRAEVSGLQAVPIFSYCPLRMEQKHKVAQKQAK